MSNDLGGNAKTLFSIDDGNGNTNLTDYDLRSADSNGVWESTSSGDLIRIYNGQIQLDLSHSLAALGATDVNALAAGDHIHDEFVYAIRLANGTLSQAKVTVDIQGQNDAAAISGNAIGNVIEAGGVHNGSPGAPSTSGQLTVTDADHGQAAFQAVAAAALAGSYGNFTFDSSTGVWGYTLDQAKADPLTDGQHVTDQLTVKSVDGTASQTITVNITGSNDNATITASATEATAVTEAGGVANGTPGDPSASGQLTVHDVDSGQAAFQAVAAAALAGSYGNFTFDSSTGAWGYTLDQAKADPLTDGQHVTDQLTVKSVDGTASQTITVNITGSNDAATITASATEATAVTEAGGVANGTPGEPSASGQLTVHDVDSGQAAFQAVAAAALAGSYGNFTFDSSTGAWGYTLDQAKADPLTDGQHVTDQLTVTSVDGTASQTITVNITGSNDAATITASATEATAVTEAGGVANGTPGDPSASGQLTVHDVDSGQAAFQAVAAAALAGSYGNFTFDSSTGVWGYTLDQAKADPLAATDVRHDRLTVTSLDGTASQTIDVTIQGSDDAIQATTITGTATGNVVEAGGLNNGVAGTPTANGTLTVHDVDNGQAVFQPIAAAALVGSYGNFTFDSSTGQWTYTLDQPKADSLAAADVRHDKLTVISLDGTATQTIDVTIQGSNDAPVLQNVSGGNQSFDETAGLALSGTMTFTDVDLTDAHTVSVQSLGSGYIGDFTPTVTLDSTGSGHGAVTAGYTLTPEQFMQFMAAGGTIGTIPTEQDYRVTISDGHGGSSTQVVQIPLAQILSGIAGPPPAIVGGTTSAQLVDTPWLDTLVASGAIEFTGEVDTVITPRFGFAHSYNGSGQFVPGEPILGTWSFSTVREYDPATGTPGEIQWQYYVPEAQARSLAQGEFETVIVPVTLIGNGSSTENIRIDLFGTDEVPFLLPANFWVFPDSDLSPWLSMPFNQLQHSQTQQFTIAAAPFVSHTIGGTISWIDPDALDHPTVSLALETHLYPPSNPLIASLVTQIQSGFHYTYETHNAFDIMDSRAAFGMIHWTFDISDSLLDALGTSPVPLFATFSVGEISGAAWSQVEIDLIGSNVAPVIHGAGAITYAVDVTQPSRIFGSFGFGDANLFDSHSVEVVEHRLDGSVIDASAFFHASVDTDSNGSGTVDWFYDPASYLAGNNEAFDLVVRDNHGGTASYAVNFDYVNGGGGGIINAATTFAVTNPPAVTEGNTGSPEPVSLHVADYVSIYAQAPYILEPYLGGTLTLQSAETFFARSGSSVDLDLGQYHVGTLEEGRLGQIVYDQQPQFFQINEDYGTISYDKAAFDFLGAGDSVTATFSFLSREYDQNGGFTQAWQHITQTINGENDAPVITGASPTQVAHASVATGATVASGTVSFTDVDLTDTHITAQYSLTPTYVSIPWYFSFVPHLETSLISDSTGGQTGSIGWTLSTNYSSLIAGLDPNQSGPDPGITPNLRIPITYDFKVGIADMGGPVTQTILYTDKTLITGPGIPTSSNPSGAVTGTSGDDIIVAVGSNNILANSAGDDLYLGAWATDPVVSYRTSPGGVSIHLASGTVDKVNGEDAFFNIHEFRGSTHNDTYDARGFVGFNEFFAVGGSDSIFGNWETEVSYAAASAGMTIDLSSGVASGASGSGIGTDSLSAVSTVTGSAFNDVMIGHAGQASSVDDHHPFSFTGGGGSDTFVFNTSVLAEIDTITDFTHGQDVLQVRGGNDPTAFAGLNPGDAAPIVNTSDLSAILSTLDPGHGAFVDVSNGQASTLYWAINGDAHAIVNLTHVTSLAANDFHIV